MDAVGSHFATSSVASNCSATVVATVAVQSHVVGNSSHQRQPDATGGDSPEDGRRTSTTGDAPPRPSYGDVVQLADFTADDQLGDDGRTERPALGRRRRLDVEDADVLQLLLPSATVDNQSPTCLRRRVTRPSLGSLLGDNGFGGRLDDARDVTVDAPWCVADEVASADDVCDASAAVTTRLETVL